MQVKGIVQQAKGDAQRQRTGQGCHQKGRRQGLSWTILTRPVTPKRLAFPLEFSRSRLARETKRRERQYGLEASVKCSSNAEALLIQLERTVSPRQVCFELTSTFSFRGNFLMTAAS
jgi:hypothetical protein